MITTVPYSRAVATAKKSEPEPADPAAAHEAAVAAVHERAAERGASAGLKPVTTGDVAPSS